MEQQKTFSREDVDAKGVTLTDELVGTVTASDQRSVSVPLDERLGIDPQETFRASSDAETHGFSVETVNGSEYPVWVGTARWSR